MPEATTNPPPAKPDPTIGHTPTPWRIYRETGVEPDGNSSLDIAKCYDIESSFSTSEDTAKANAAFIVRAVNAHAALVSALRDLLGAIDEQREVRLSLETQLPAAREALELARGDA